LKQEFFFLAKKAGTLLQGFNDIPRVLRILPFATNTDLNEAAKEADISHD
jgi:hypothetical protein